MTTDLRRSRPDGRILIVDDDPIVRDVLRRYLTRDGFDVSEAADGVAALAACASQRPDLVLLDLMLPRLDGLEVFRRLRTREDRAAVIMLTARGQETDRIVGLESGADDYVAKPFSPREVVARVRAVLRRVSAPTGQSRTRERSEPLAFEGLRIDPDSREVELEGEPVTLTPREFDLLLFFASNPKIAFSRSQLLDELWDIAYDGDSSTVTVHVRRLREKIEADLGADPNRHRLGRGYRFEP